MVSHYASINSIIYHGHFRFIVAFKAVTLSNQIRQVKESSMSLGHGVPLRVCLQFTNDNYGVLQSFTIKGFYSNFQICTIDLYLVD